MNDEGAHPARVLSAVMLTADARIDRRILDEARSLVKAGWTVTVLAAPPPVSGDRHDEELYPDVSIVRVVPKPYVDVALPQVPKFREASRLSWRILFGLHDYLCYEALQRPATVYVAHDLPQLLPAAMAASYHHAYFVYDSHELYPEQGFTRYNLKSLLIELERGLMPLADQVITVNQSIAELMAARYKIPVPEVILNSPALHQQLTLPIPHTNLLREELQIPDDQLILLYQGGYAPNRNLQNLVEAIPLLQNRKITLILMGPGLATASDLVSLARRSGLLNQRIFFRDAVSQAQLLTYTASANAGIIPYVAANELNNYYCTPNKLFEFIVAGLPILASDLPELNRFVSGQQVGLNRPLTTAAEMAQAIDAFFQMDLASFRQRAAALSPEFVWDIEGKKIVQIYQRLLAAPPRADKDYSGSDGSQRDNQNPPVKPPLATTALLAQVDLVPLVSVMLWFEMMLRLLKKFPRLAHFYYAAIRPRLRWVYRKLRKRELSG